MLIIWCAGFLHLWLFALLQFGGLPASPGPLYRAYVDHGGLEVWRWLFLAVASTSALSLLAGHRLPGLAALVLLIPQQVVLMLSALWPAELVLEGTTPNFGAPALAYAASLALFHTGAILDRYGGLGWSLQQLSRLRQ